MLKMPTYIGLYWCGQSMPMKNITIRAENEEQAELKMQEWLKRLAGKGEWQYIITEKKLSGIINTLTEEHLVTL